MKKLFSKIFTSLLILGVVTGCGTTISSGGNSTSEPPVVTKKLGLSLASKVTTDKGIIVTQNNDVSKPKSGLKLVSLTGGTSKDELEISPTLIPHTIIEGSENTFDLAITGLTDDEFSITISETLTNTDVTEEFSWVYFVDGSKDGDTTSYSACKLVNEDADYCVRLSGDKPLFENESTNTKIFRIFSETYDFESSDLTVKVEQETLTTEPSNVRFFKDGSPASEQVIIKSFDFKIEYDNSLGYTDLNNIKFSITSDLFEVKYTSNTDLDTFYDEGTVIDMSLTDETVPYEAISVVYRKDGQEEFTIINNYLVVFPHLGGIKSDEIQNPALSIGHKESLFLTQIISFFDYEKLYLPVDSRMKVYENTWTGIDRADGKLIIEGYEGYDSLPLSIKNSSPEAILFSYYSIVDPNDVINYIDDELYYLRVREVIALNLSFKLEISGVIFDLGTLYEIVNPNSIGIDGTARFAMNPLQKAFK